MLSLSGLCVSLIRPWRGQLEGLWCTANRYLTPGLTLSLPITLVVTLAATSLQPLTRSFTISY